MSPSRNLSLPNVTTLTIRLHRHSSRDASPAKIRGSSQATKNVADIVGRDDAFLKGTIPVPQDAFDDFDPGVVNIGDGDVEAVLRPVGQMEEWAEFWRRSVKIGTFFDEIFLLAGLS